MNAYEAAFLIMAALFTAWDAVHMQRGERLGYAVFSGCFFLGAFLIYRGVLTLF